ncbi:MAG: PKD domain-containing protein [Chloroflexi bacterium]|nr:PKD domain-containing protein [Chloroflexota bacterium]
MADMTGIRRFDSDKCALQPFHYGLRSVAIFTYPNTGDTHTAVIDWGDGTVQPGIVRESGGYGVVSGDHAYSFDGHYTVTITVTDNHGAAGVDTQSIIVGHEDPGPDEAARCFR